VRRIPAWPLATVLVGVALQLHGGIGATDLAYSIRLGDVAISSHAVAHSNLMSFSAASNSWTDQQWGAQVVFAAIFGIAGWAGMAAVLAALSGLLAFLIYATCRARGAIGETAAILTFLALIVGYAGLSLRAQIVGAVLFTATLYVLAASARPKRLLALLPIAVIWSNTHGSFVLEPVLIGFALLDNLLGRRTEWKALTAVLVGCLAATLINPFGFGVWTYLGNLTTNHVLHSIAVEWQIPSVTTADGVLFYSSLLVAAAVTVWKRHTLRPAEILLLLAFAALAVSASRNQLWWALVATTTVSRAFDKPVDRIAADFGLPLVVCGVSIAFALVLAPWGLLTSAKLSPVGLPGAPAGATNSLQAALLPGQRVFSFQAWSSWFELALPDNPVLVDSIFESNSQDTWAQYFSVSSANPGWDSTLHNWNVAALALSRPEQKNLINAAKQSPDWHLIHEDSESDVFVRRHPTGITCQVDACKRVNQCSTHAATALG